MGYFTKVKNFKCGVLLKRELYYYNAELNYFD
jgi:hypothetical protein